MTNSQTLQKQLKDLEDRRKRGELSLAEFYKGLLNLIVELKEYLIKEEMTEKQIIKQIPLILVFLHSQIQDLIQRGN